MIDYIMSCPYILTTQQYRLYTCTIDYITGYPCRRKEMFYLTTLSTHCIYDYMASDIWLRTILIVRKETRCRHIGYYFLLAAMIILYAPSHRQDSAYQSCTGWNEK